MRHIDAVVCVDTAYINWLYASVPGRLNYAHKLWYVPNFVDNARHMKQASWEAVEGRTTILFPRRMEIRRGPLLLLEALEKLWAAGRSYRVVFCGPGQCSEEVRRRAQRLGVYDRVTITERSFEEMPGEYSRSQLAVIPTVAYEGTSLSCIEAMASGCPVVVTHVGGLGNLVIPGFNGLCVDLRADDLAASIERVLSDQALWMELAENGRKTAAALDIDRWRVEWLRVIHSVSSRQHPTALVLE
jgi:glycosyltransferase involved in cell wall biosynthesis